jgi:solute:Na+ symporter, SSS family
VVVTLLTPPERQEVLAEFYRRCKPPGFWGPVTQTLSSEERIHAQREMHLDVWNCALGIVFCCASVALTTNLFGRHGLASVFWAALAVTACYLFVRSWWGRGIFQSLESSATATPSAFHRDPTQPGLQEK